MRDLDRSFVIGRRTVGPGHPTYVIAELSANHHQSFDFAVKLVHEAARIGADAVKLQTYTPDTITLKVDSPLFVHGHGSPWAGQSLHDLYAEAYTPWEWQPKLKAVAEGLGLDLFSSAFDPTAVDFLEAMGVPAHKVASFELVDLPLIERMARTGKPLLMSTGMATLAEIEDAVRAARGAGARALALLKCTSAYPAPPEEMHLRTLVDLARRFDCVVGLSDHTLAADVPAAAVALGASIVEKHLTMSRADAGPDSSFSLEPAEFEAMIRSVRTVERALGEVRYGPSEREQQSRKFRRSLFVVTDVRAGDVLSDASVRSIRPGHGLAPKHLPEVLGRRAAIDIARGTPLAWDLLA